MEERSVRTWVLVVSGVVALCAPVLGHHSFSEYYIEADTIEVEGEVVEFQYRNPHSWIHIMGQEVFGKPKPYAAEWASVSRLERDGITARTLKARRHRPHLGEPEPQPERQPHPPQAYRAPIRSLEVGRAERQNRGENRDNRGENR